MAYKQMTIEAGAVVEVRKYYDWAHGRRHREPRERRQKSTDKQTAKNRQQAEDTLRWKLNAGCKPGDYHITLTYGGDAPTSEEAKRHLRNYLAKLKRLYAKAGTELRWLAVTEYAGRRPHHHLILNQGPELFEVVKKWQHGRPKVTLLDGSGDYSALAAYLIKETDKTFRDPEAVQKQRWSCSRNWPKPKITTKVIKAERWLSDPRPRKGYAIVPDSVFAGVDEMGYPYQTYRMVKLRPGPGG